jgi:hypothetical protein
MKESLRQERGGGIYGDSPSANNEVGGGQERRREERPDEPVLAKKTREQNQEGKNREGECLWRLAGGKKKTRSAALKNAARKNRQRSPPQ